MILTSKYIRWRKSGLTTPIEGVKYITGPVERQVLPLLDCSPDKEGHRKGPADTRRLTAYGFFL